MAVNPEAAITVLGPQLFYKAKSFRITELQFEKQAIRADCLTLWPSSTSEACYRSPGHEVPKVHSAQLRAGS